MQIGSREAEVAGLGRLVMCSSRAGPGALRDETCRKSGRPKLRLELRCWQTGGVLSCCVVLSSLP